jgi:hypothetical protein
METRAPVLRNSVVRKVPDLGLGQDMVPAQTTGVDQTVPVSADGVPAVEPPYTPLSSRHLTIQDCKSMARCPQGASSSERSSISDDHPAGVREAAKQVAPTSLATLDVGTSIGEADAVVVTDLETPFETPLSSGEPSPSTPSKLLPRSEAFLEPAAADGSLQHSTLSGGLLHVQQMSKAQSSNERSADTCSLRTGFAPRNEAWGTKASEQPARSETGPSNLTHFTSSLSAQLRSHQDGSVAPQSERASFNSPDGRTFSNRVPSGHETSDESDGGTIEEDSFQFQVPLASLCSSADYSRHVGPPFGWATVTPRFASQGSTPRPCSKSLFHSPRKLSAKQARSNLEAEPIAPGRSELCTGLAPPPADLYTLSKGQLISML